jgi:hypothetical protein
VIQRIMTLCVLLATVGGCAAYTGPSMTATVIDGSTQQPLEGVHVVAEWEVDYEHMPQFTYSEQGHGTAFLNQMEAVTDASGVFHFPEWRSDALPQDVPAGGVMTPMSPIIRLFKPGYVSRLISNTWRGGYGVNPNYRADPMQESQWNGKTIDLQPLPRVIPQGKWTIYVNGPTYDMLRHCRWKLIPKYLSSLIAERERILKLSPREAIFLDLPTFEKIDQSGDPVKCGRAQDVLAQRNESK